MENKKLWFRAKTFGWGWYPVTWQGWFVILLYLVSVLQTALQIKNHLTSTSDFLQNYMLPIAISTTFLIIICYATGEKPEWRWGK
ncbi:MAG: hypothetical protein WCK48_03530 [bacterium]